MLTLRKARDRGHADHGWLQSFHSFSFADYHDPEHMGFGNLRVINDDYIAPGTGFGTHGHRDMEIVTYVLSGALAHKDSLGSGAVIWPGDVQRMTAGRGVQHSELSHAHNEITHLLQIWILPSAHGLAPGYEQRQFDAAENRGRLCLIASPAGRDGSVTVHADASIRAGLFDADERTELLLDPRRKTYVHLVRGQLSVNGQVLVGGDGAKLVDEGRLTLTDAQDAEVLVFDLAA